MDRELDEAVALARAFAISRDLAAGDVAAFEDSAQRVIERYGYTLAATPLGGGVQLAETEQSLGDVPLKLPASTDSTSSDEDEVTIAPLHRSASGRWVVSVQVPVRAGAFRYRIDIAVPARVFQHILNEQHLPAAWTPVLLDADWTVVARDPGREKFIGQKGAAQGLQHMPDAVHEVRLLEGDTARSAHSHSARYGWTTAVAAPDSASRRAFIGPVLLAGASGFGVAAFAIGGVLVFFVYLARGIGALATATAQLGEERDVRLPRLPVRELTLVGEGLRQAAAKIAENRRQLEARVAEATSELRREEEERRQAEAALAHRQKLDSLGQLTSGIAHDFNN
ncbi:MAG: hypothetical protein ACREFI_05235, partial [Stellaceae bacterium]